MPPGWRLDLRLRQLCQDLRPPTIDNHGLPSAIRSLAQEWAESANKNFGLLGISERAALLGGRMTVESPDRGGLALQVEIPSPYPSV